MNGRLWEKLVYPPLGVVLVLLAWEGLCVGLKLQTAVLPRPGEVFNAIVSRWDLLLSEGWVTFKETMYGFLLALVVGSFALARRMRVEPELR